MEIRQVDFVREAQKDLGVTPPKIRVQFPMHEEFGTY